MNLLSVDFESYSACDLSLAGSFIYANHPSTDILCISFRDDDQEEIWTPESGPLPDWVLEHIMFDGEFAAWNAQFEINIWAAVGVKKYGFQELPTARWHCTMAQALAMGLPGKLSKCGSFLGLDEQKDTIGAKAMGLLSRPDKKGERPKGSAAQLASLYAYCTQDTLAERTIMKSIRPLQAQERPVWLLDQKINNLGVKIDRTLARAAQELWETYSQELIEEFTQITGDPECVPTTIARIKVWLNQQLSLEKPIVSLNEDVVTELLAGSLPDNVRRVLEIRQLLAGAALKKYAKLESSSDCSDGRLRGALRYHGASTGRWTSQGAQLHNLKREGLAKIESHYDAETVRRVTIQAVTLGKQLVIDKDARGIELLFNDVGDTLGSLVRPTLIAAPGKQLVASDFNAIECRVSAWLADQEDLLEDFRNKRDPYLGMASDIYGKPREQITKSERFFGKTATLGCQYSMGSDKFRDTVAKDGVIIDDAFASHVVSTYREKNTAITTLWRNLQNRVVLCITSGQPTNINKYLSAAIDGDWLLLTLPNGRLLSFYKPTLGKGKFNYPEIKFIGVDPQSGSRRHEKLYGGKLCLGGSSLILTDSGLVPLDQIQLHHKLWDGDDWVSHSGLVYQGRKKTIRRWGVSMTPDHEVLTESGWENAGDIKRYHRAYVRLPENCSVRGVKWDSERVGSGMYLREFDSEDVRNVLAKGSTKNLWVYPPAPSPQLKGYSEPDIWIPDDYAIRRVRWEEKYMGSNMRLWEESTQTLWGLPTSKQGDSNILRVQVKRGDECEARYVSPPSILGLEEYAGSLSSTNAPSISQLRSERDRCMQAVGEVREFLGGYGSDISEWSYARTQEQRSRLLSQELQVGDIRGSSQQQKRGSTPDKWYDCEAVLEKDWHQCNNALLSASEWLADGQDGFTSRFCEPVFDILNAGPQHRFTVVGDRPFLSHNCENVTQAASRDVMANSMRQLNEEGYDVVLTVHDEIVIETADPDIPRIEEIMCRVPKWAPGLPIAVESQSLPFYSK